MCLNSRFDVKHLYKGTRKHDHIFQKLLIHSKEHVVQIVKKQIVWKTRPDSGLLTLLQLQNEPRFFGNKFGHILRALWDQKF